MRFDATGRPLLTPVDRDAPARMRRLRALGLGEYPDPAFDAFARHLAALTGAMYAMVTFVEEHEQFFAGLHAPVAFPPDPKAQGALLGRRLDRDHGFCPHVVVRRKALVLDDISEYPRFAGNPVVDRIGIRSYLGAPLIDRTGIALGTVCAADVEPRRWGPTGLEAIKSLAAELVAQIHHQENVGR